MPFATSAGEADPWLSRFAATLGDPETMAQVVAQFVQGQSGAGEGGLAPQITEHLQQAGWPLGSIEPRLIRLADGIWAAQVPPAGIYLLQEARPTPGECQVMLDARLQDETLGLISATGEADNLQPMFELLRKHDDETWKVVWSPQGQRYWISTDGAIRFQGRD